MRAPRAAGLCLLLSALVLAPADLEAQRFGVSGGLVMSSLEGDGVSGDPDSRSSFDVGVFGIFPLTDMLSLTPGIYYVEKGAVDPNDDLALKLNYVEIPILLDVGLYRGDGVGLSAFAGPTFAFEVQCFQEVTYVSDGVEDTGHVECEDLDAPFVTASLDFGAMVGAGVTFALSEGTSLLVNGGIDFGLTDLDELGDAGGVKNRAFFVNAGLVWSPGS